MRLQLSILTCLALGVLPTHAAEFPLTDLSRLELKGAQAEVTTHHGLAALKITQREGGPGDGFAIIKDFTFRNGVIDLDVSGAPSKTADGQARGFIGVAFRIAAGGARYEEIYIRPTNGRADDQLRRNHSVQYVSAPDWPWDRLRKENPGVYESYADMAADEWTHLRIAVQGTNASLFVNGAAQPCLIVHDLKLGESEGAVALWIGPGTEGYFRKLSITRDGEKPPEYGANAAAGHYVQTPDARIYYERYGEGGTPLVMLHGGEYGYIDEFGELISAMSRRRTVIAVATRGYGRSERGKVPLSHRQFALDAAQVIQQVFPNGEKVDVLGFSEGAITSYILASTHPERIRRLIAIGGSLGRDGMTKEALEAPPLTPEAMQKQVPDLVANRKRVMAKPEQWEPLIRELEQMYSAPVYVKREEIRAIQAPTLIMAGDHDYYTRTDHTVEIYRLLPKGQLGLIPGCGHVVLDCRADLVIGMATAFLDQPDR